MSGKIHMCFQLQRESKPAGKRFVLDIDLDIPASGVTAIFGHSGCGKTTLLRWLAGLESGCPGFLEVDGSVWQNDNGDNDILLPAWKRPIGYVFQEPSLFPHLTVSGNFNFALKRSASALNQSGCDEIIELLGLSALLDNKPDELSGGEQQRVAIARALMVGPQLLLMDEPLSALDRQRKQEILPYLERIKQTLDIPMIYVSHSMDEVARLADYAVLLDNGMVSARGFVNDVFSRVGLSGFDADDAGSVLEARVESIDPEWHLAELRFSGGRLWLNDACVVRPEVERDELVRIRVPAKDVSIALSDYSESSIANRIPATIQNISDIDVATALLQLKLENEDGSSMLLARLTRRSVHQLKLETGMQVWAQIKSASIIR
ncbi:molybdenum ABC transporter ATP-binding protein [Bacterioplanoides sp.]|uniref:molybdenum ABC transporter ATP-binding protein n=1 Tax=Bacterioplanoides sp. TaxID=2066072 RepID=UPI003B5BDCB6